MQDVGHDPGASDQGPLARGRPWASHPLPWILHTGSLCTIQHFRDLARRHEINPDISCSLRSLRPPSLSSLPLSSSSEGHFSPRWVPIAIR